MTRYCVDPARSELIATWGTGEGEVPMLMVWAL
jgi:hypothetical protein